MLALATPVLAARPSKTPAIDAFERGDYMTAFKLLSPKAKAGDAEAQYRLGIIRDEGGMRAWPKARARAAPMLRRAFGCSFPQANAGFRTKGRPRVDERRLFVGRK